MVKGSSSWSCVYATTWWRWVRGGLPGVGCAFVAPSLRVVCGVRLGLVFSGFTGLVTALKGVP